MEAGQESGFETKAAEKAREIPPIPLSPYPASAPRRRRRQWLLALAITVVLLGVASPFLWAAYHAYAGEMALSRYHSAEARSHFDACLRIWPWSGSNYLHLLAARAARREGDFEEAYRLLHECPDTVREHSAEAALEMAMLRAARGDLDATAEPLRKFARQDPRLVPLVLEAFAEGYLRTSRILDALRTTDDWLRLEPDNPQAYFVRGKVHRQAGVAQEVAADYQHVLELDPQRSEAHWWLALALLDIGRYVDAYNNLVIVERQRANDPEVQVRKAICLWRMEREQEACQLLDGVLAEQPDHGLALLTRGQIAMNSERFAEAEPLLRQAARLLPFDYKAQNALWNCLRQQNKKDAAEAQRERMDVLYERRTRQADIRTRLLGQNPDDPALQCELGKLDLQLGAPRVGEAWLLSALRLDPNYLPALEALAQHYQERGEKDLAEEYRRRAQLVSKN
ncbi:MAG: tetratricopeptide repeat protein [Gemmataceae bacterium]